jgi:multidrug efflux pump subunit AcrA (membrane-fusion protein)
VALNELPPLRPQDLTPEGRLARAELEDAHEAARQAEEDRKHMDAQQVRDQAAAAQAQVRRSQTILQKMTLRVVEELELLRLHPHLTPGLLNLVMAEFEKWKGVTPRG